MTSDITRTGTIGSAGDELGAALAGLQRRWEPVEALPVPGCGVCSAASTARAHAHMAGDPGGVAQATGVIGRHPHTRESEGAASCWILPQ